MPEGVGYGPQDTASVGLNLNVIGKHAYAFSGLNVASTTPKTLLSFRTGNFYLVGEFQVNAGLDDDDPASSVSPTTANIKLNGVSIAIIGCGGATPDRRPSSIKQKVIIAPYTEVEGIVDGTDEADQYNSLTLVGKIYK